jgi:cytochrome c553
MILSSLLFTLALGQADKPAFSQDDLDFFEKKVRPVLVARCYECHATQAEKPKAGFFVDSRAAILQGGDSGPGAVAGEPANSRLIKAISYDDELLQMPPDGKLPPAEIEVLSEWVRRGLPFPESTAAVKQKTKIDIEAGRAHWAFRPLRTHDASATDPWIERKIDSFLLARMREAQLQPAARSSRETLLRRAKFDLLGLPPEPAEIGAFASDESPDAYVRLIDRYLASPQYGERWGRFWLDMTRYCDVPESWRESPSQAYLYRDWVVQALNDDLPYHDFVRKQFAADLLPNTRPEDTAALGYLGLSPTYWKELKLDHNVIKQVVAEEWEERIEAIGATFLGLTAACARCHDHKFDPITQHDYYAIAGVLASIQLDDRPIIPADLAQTAQSARNQVKELQKQAGELSKQKERTPEQNEQLSKFQSQIEALKLTPHFATPTAFAISDAAVVVSPEGAHRTKIEYKPGQAQDVAMQIRGIAANPGPVVPRRFLSVLATQPTPFREGSGRRELAEAIVTDAAPLAARVIVNRVWRHHFGRGLVTTPSNFGTQGERPSHPELLDNLAARFVAAGWSLKWLHREIMLSAAYQQSSVSEARKVAIDPDNVLLARMMPRRLEVEAWRDAVLSVTGELTTALGGPPADLSATTNVRRTLYGTVKRRELDDLLRLYDFPDPVTHAATREATITPLQQLFVLNAPFLHARSAALVARLNREGPGGTEQRVTWLTQKLFGRPAETSEIQTVQSFLEQSQAAGVEPNEAWREYCHALLTSNEFMFID